MKERLVKDVHLALQAAGIDPKRYSGHSFCIGVATMAAQCGLQDWLIKTLGQWESMAYTLYMWMPREMLFCLVVVSFGAIKGDCRRVVPSDYGGC